MNKNTKIKSPKGFLFSTAEAAIKKAGRKDLGLILSETEAVVAGVFTANKVKAAPVKLDIKRIRSGKGRAIIVNSGNANACTSEQGQKDALEMTELTAGALGLKAGSVYVCSTGVIGAFMPMERIRAGITMLSSSLGRSGIEDVAAAIMTTDTFPKIVSRRIKIADVNVTITGICKGAGMICPNMATMLCFILTDAAIERPALDKALRSAVEQSFNLITVDGDMSTNDTVLIIANGKAGNSPIEQSSAAFEIFSSALARITLELSEMIIRDGEGASKFVKVIVRNARNYEEAKRGAFAIANSMLVKTALCGNDANWGRIIAALGYSGINVKEDKIDIVLNGVKVAAKGISTGKDKDANERLKAGEIIIVADLHLGKGTATVLTSDLTEEYVRINAEYRT
ncbi:MAG: bifunctional glutamate N-acetyltransferase/amino-acid acetyltransferase ArgJ [Nitrospirae bacterium]|nr:bifunctional glutamate N-acetyltransferase/amino-acid acetyltransferase ArgJ [Nitrospirota bacterium]